jgi:nitroreductase
MTLLPLTADELLTTTRSVRKRLDLERPVDLALVREAITVALQAPSGSNAQGWHFVVVTDAAKRAAIGDFYRRSVEEYLASERSAARLHADDPDRAPVQQRVGDSVAHLGRTMGQVPVLVLPCLRVPAGLPSGSQAALWGSLHPAAWSYMRACAPARARHGLDDAAPEARGRGRAAARAAGRRAPGRAHPHRALHRRHLPARRPAAARAGAARRRLVSLSPP